MPTELRLVFCPWQDGPTASVLLATVERHFSSMYSRMFSQAVNWATSHQRLVWTPHTSFQLVNFSFIVFLVHLFPDDHLQSQFGGTCLHNLVKSGRFRCDVLLAFLAETPNRSVFGSWTRCFWGSHVGVLPWRLHASYCSLYNGKAT